MIFDPVGSGGRFSPFLPSGTSLDEFSSMSLAKGVTTRHVGDMVGDKSTQESPEDVVRSSPEAADGSVLQCGCW